MTTKKLPAQLRLGKHKKGFTLTEIAIVLGIMGLVLGAIWVAAAGVYNNLRVNNATTAVMQIAQGIRALYATSATTGYSSVTDMTSSLITAHAVPNNLVNGTELSGPFPGGATVIYATSDGNGFVVTMSAVSKANCISLLTAVAGTGRDPGLFKADAATGNPSTGDAAATGNALTVPMTLAYASAGSALGTAPSTYGGCGIGDLVKVRFGFSLK
ncbi:MAG: type II secretion system protein [Bdellovibrionales bacterium]